MLPEEDLKDEVYRGSGADGGGSWGLRLTHIPSGEVVEAGGVFDAGDDPKQAIAAARRDLLRELEVRLEGA